MEDAHSIEHKWQKKWQEARLFAAEPQPGQKKFFLTFPYPYVNGLPHVGHLFTMMRVEAFARYKRAQGYNVLFPQAWHATGVPITAAARRVAEGDPKQLQILRDNGVSEEEIPAFVNPEHWVHYFAPRYKRDVMAAGISIDWRREFITTNLNPQYDAFIRWQFELLHEKGYVQKGNHPVVWCPKDNAPVGDHDRSVGEGETPQEFVLVKHKLDDGRFVVTATLRQDTILGITNLYANPTTEYREIIVDGERWIVSETAAKQFAEQGWNITVDGNVPGRSLIGRETEEFGGYKVIILPAGFVDPKFGTGLVHSVPSDSADDLIALYDLQKDEKTCEEFGLDPARIRAIQPIEVLNTPGVGGNPAKHFLDEYKVTSQHDRKKLDEIKPKLYKLSYYSATFNEKYKEAFSKNLEGVQVQDGKEFIKDELIRQNWAKSYYQLTGKVVCRCQTPCIVKIVSDQWFLKYSDPQWKALAHEALDNVQLFPEKVRQQFEHVLDWLNDWACTREYGIGSRLPWDQDWLIESLSDSTIYNAYYTISHIIKDVPVQYLDRKFFDFIFLGKGTAQIPGIDTEKLRDEFNYWYPVDFRNSGKDLVQNHLSFFLFNHAAIFPKHHWPKGIGVNGYVMVNGEKMSKSVGNVIPLRQLIEQYGADVTRMTILNGGEGIDDPNWDSTFAASLRQKLGGLLRNADTPGQAAPTPVDAWLRSTTAALIGRITEAMEQTNFRTALQLAFFEYTQALKWYLSRTIGKPHQQTWNDALEAQLIMLSPFIPHICEEAWERMGKKGFISSAPWPQEVAKDNYEILDAAERMIRTVGDDIQQAMRKNATPKHITLYLAAEWKRDAYAYVAQAMQSTRNPAEITASAPDILKTQGEEFTRLVHFLVKAGRVQPSVHSGAEERHILSSAREYFASIAKGAHVEIAEAEQHDVAKAKNGLPGKPSVVVE